MRDDALPEEQDAGGDDSTTRTGPRHAAPRKSLMTRANASAGKAIAMAAMPTAVLMGMGLTPRLASAAELPKNPYTGDSCVSQSDSPSPSSSPSASPSATPSPKPTPSASASAAKTSSTAKSPTSSPSPSSSSKPASSSGSGSGGLLGLGSAISGLGNALTGGSSSPSSASPTPSASPSANSSGSGSGNLLGSVTKTLGTTTGSVAAAAKGATSSVTKTVSNAASALPTSASSSGNGTAYPCPTYNAKALANAGLEQLPELLPNQPWVLKSSLLTLTGLDYHGIVKVKTDNGTVKDVLKFTATAVDIKDLHQIVDGPNGTFDHVKAAPGSTSTMSNGTVTMYTESLKGNLFGLIPVNFSPDSPPPLNVSYAFFTNVTIEQAGQFGGTLTVPGMNAYGNNSPD